jgi:putative transposase
MSQDDQVPARLRWARLRFSIIGQLLTIPPKPGELAGRIAELAEQTWRDKVTGKEYRFSGKTIERMYYQALKSKDPFRALERKVPRHAGTHPSITKELAEAIARQYQEHPTWNYQLHYDNLALFIRDNPLGAIPSYATVCRFMKDHDFRRQKKQRCRKNGGSAIVSCETRSYEITHVNALWHFDFHEGKRNVLISTGEWKKPYLFCVLDDCSRICCHAQWYTERENTCDLVHGMSQGLQKRGLPCGIYSDRGSPMLSAEFVEGIERLGIVQWRTLPRSPEQNGKQEHFWTRIESRLMPMLEGEPELTLELLNTATQAWIEQEYHRTIHGELKKTPLARYLEGPDRSRPCPSSDELRRVFRMEISRTQRRSDGTVTVEGVRFEVPSVYRSLVRLRLRVARWNLSNVDLVDPQRGTHLATLLPLDKARNADGARRVLPEASIPPTSLNTPAGVAPLLRKLMADYAATGLPPAYLPQVSSSDSHKKDCHDDDQTSLRL